eukprot:5461099-Prymnesium_polylepis.1
MSYSPLVLIRSRWTVEYANEEGAHVSHQSLHKGRERTDRYISLTSFRVLSVARAAVHWQRSVEGGAAHHDA